MFAVETEILYYWKSFIRILYPAYCPVCQAPLGLEENGACRQCASKIEPIKDPCCLKCSRPLPPFGPTRTICPACRSNRPYYDQGFSLVRYDETAKTIFHQIKFKNKPWLIKIFEPYVSAFSLASDLSRYDAIIPVPLDSKRKREREFNQSEMISNMVKRFNRETAPPILRVLKKNRKTPPQSQLNRAERLCNLKDAFSVARAGLIAGKKILLIDDILTTGTTINECAKLLKENGAESVDFLTIARA
jgi:ComF family protein